MDDVEVDSEVGKDYSNEKPATKPQHQKPTSRCPPQYLKTPTGIIKLIEMVLCLLTFACSLGGNWTSIGGGWVEFVSVAGFVTTTVWFMLHLVNSIPRYLIIKPWEFIFCVAFAIMFFVSAILAAIRARSQTVNRGAVGATSFFSFACVIVYGMIDAYFQVYNWRTYTTMSATVKRSISMPPPSMQPLHSNI